jgi:hypothetical protein
MWVMINKKHGGSVGVGPFLKALAPPLVGRGFNSHELQKFLTKPPMTGCHMAPPH